MSEQNWTTTFKKAQINNRQLDFSNNAFLSYINQSTKEPEIEMIKLRSSAQFTSNSSNTDSTENLTYILSDVDKRGRLFKNLSEHNRCDLCIFYPLTREKFRFTCNTILISKSEIIQPSTKKFTIQENDFQNLFGKLWQNELSADEHKLYAELEPDYGKIEKEFKEELVIFNTPELQSISGNFACQAFVPFRVEHTQFTMPQVVADARMPMFESDFKPYKYNKKYVHFYQDELKTWKFQAQHP